MSVAAKIQAMIDTLEAAKADADKHDSGNNAAGTRVRTAMQAAKNAAQEVRVQVSTDREARK